jgi:TonB-dependent starch-binding outer membrane protein SusC
MAKHLQGLVHKPLSYLITAALAAMTIAASAQESREVTGKVINRVDGQAIPGVSVFHKGKTVGTITDTEGNYRLLASDTTTLVFSFIGFIREEVKVGDRQTINITMAEDITGLEEIVVVGYGEQKRSNLSGAISSVDVDQLGNRAQTRLDQALQGMVSGISVTRNGGAPGARPTIHIRGVGSINDTEPLWIVDGIRMAPGNHFEPDDVESIEVLKDASASAIYGASAAHGVILVTTKRGKGQVQINLKSSMGKRSPVKLPDLLRSEDFVRYKKQSREAAGQNPEPSWDNYEHDTDWIKEYYGGSGALQSHDLSIARGDDQGNYYLSVGNDHEEGILIDNSYDRYSLRLNSDIKLSKWLKVGESLLLSRVEENPIGNNNENYSGGIPYRSIPIMPVRDANNSFGGWGRAPVYFQGPNPVATQYQQHETRTYQRVDGNAYAEITPLKGFSIRGSVGFNHMSYLLEKFDEAFDYGAFANPNGMLTYATAQDQTLLGNLVASYSRAFAEHNVKVMAGYEAIRTEVKHFNVSAMNFPIDVAWSINISKGAIAATDRHNVYQRRLLSQFGRLNYNFKEKYFFEASIRRDGSSPKFGPAYQWGLFPSYSVAWRVSEERFFDNVPVITSFKIRASTGRLGSDAIPDFLWSKTYTSQFSTYAFDAGGKNKVTGFFISKFPNEGVKWEEVNMHNVAIDLEAFDGKLSLSADYYIKDTKDLLYEVPVPNSIGIAVHNFDPVNPAINIGTMRNSGIDLDLGYRNQWGKFNFSATANTSFLKNELLTLVGDASIVGGNGGGQIGGMTRTQPGMPVSSFYGYIVYRMFHSDGEVATMNTYAKDGYYQEAGTSGGDLMYLDISGPEGVPDGEITAQYDRTFIGNPWPKMTYGLNVSLAYNQIVDFSLQFQGIHGVDVFNANKAYSRNFFGDSNTTTDIYEAWTPERRTQHPRNIASDPNQNFGRPSTYFVEDGSYLKLRNVQVGVNIPRRFTDKVRINKLRFYLNANNVLTFTKYSGLDPEIAGSNVSRGVDFGMYPQVKTYTAGLELQF